MYLTHTPPFIYLCSTSPESAPFICTTPPESAPSSASHHPNLPLQSASTAHLLKSAPFICFSSTPPEICPMIPHTQCTYTSHLPQQPHNPLTLPHGALLNMKHTPLPSVPPPPLLRLSHHHPSCVCPTTPPAPAPPTPLLHLSHQHPSCICPTNTPPASVPRTTPNTCTQPASAPFLLKLPHEPSCPRHTCIRPPPTLPQRLLTDQARAPAAAPAKHTPTPFRKLQQHLAVPEPPQVPPGLPLAYSPPPRVPAGPPAQLLPPLSLSRSHFRSRAS